KPLPLGVDAPTLQSAMRDAFLTLIGEPANLTVSGGPHDFDITFNKALGDVAQIVPQVVPLFIDAAKGADRLRFQSTYEDTFFLGGEGSDTASLNVDAISLKAFTPTDVVGHVNVTEFQHGDVSHNEKQLVSLHNVTGGTFELALSGHTTVPLAWDAQAA